MLNSTTDSDLWIVRKREDTATALVVTPFCIPVWFGNGGQASVLDVGCPPHILNVRCPDRLRPVLWDAAVHGNEETRQTAERWLRVFLESEGLADVVRGGDVLLPVWGLVSSTMKTQKFYWCNLAEGRLTCLIVSDRFRELWWKNGLSGALFCPIILSEAPEELGYCCPDRRHALISEIIFASPPAEESEKFWLMVVHDVRPNWYDVPPDACPHCGAGTDLKGMRLSASEIIRLYRSRNMIPPWFVSEFDIFTCRWYEDAIICSNEARQLLIYCECPVSYSPAGYGILSFGDS